MPTYNLNSYVSFNFPFKYLPTGNFIQIAKFINRIHDYKTIQH